MVLVCYRSTDLVAEFEFVGGQFRRHSASAHPAIEGVASLGFYDDISGHTIALFVFERELWLSLDVRVWKVPKDVRAHLECLKEPQCQPDDHLHERRIYSGGSNRLIIESTNETLVDFTYSPPPRSYFAFDWTQTEDEDFDMCLWLHNVLNSVERRQIFISTRENL